MVICPNCSGKFEEKLPKCPYCGYLYEPGAQREYMEDIQEIRDDLERLKDKPRELYQREARAALKRLLHIFAVLLVVVAVFGIMLFGLHKWMNLSESEEEIKARIAWQREYYPLLDEWYEAGDYDAILAFCKKQASQENYAFYSWEHSRFISQFEQYTYCMELKERLENKEELTGYEMGEGLIASLELLFYLEKESYTKEEQVQLEGYQKEVEAFLYGDFGFTPKEIEKLLREADMDGYLDYGVCYDYTDNRGKE